MKNLTTFIISSLFLTTFGFATVTVDGYALLENQTDHSGIQVLFERTAPSSLTDTSTTDANGYFTAQLENGLYDVTYTKDEYFSESLTDQSFFSNTTLSSLTLLEHTTLINVPSLFATIQSAIDHAFIGDTVLVQPGTYVENINYNGKNIVVGSLYLTTQDTSYISSTIIDGNQNGSVVTFESGNEITSLLCGFTIRNGLSDWGGGVSCSGYSATLSNLIIEDNSGNNGGGIYCQAFSAPIITDVIIRNNTSWFGGGFYHHSGVSWPTSTPVLTNVSIVNNSVTYYGGGIFINYSLNRAWLIELIYKLAGRKYHVDGETEDFWLCIASKNQKHIVEMVFGTKVKSRYTEILFHPELRCACSGRKNSVIGTVDAMLEDSNILYSPIARQQSFHAFKL